MEYTVIIFDKNYETEYPAIICANTYSERITKYKLKKLVLEEKDAFIGIVFEGNKEDENRDKYPIMSYKPRKK